MSVHKAIRILEREWTGLRSYLERCGEIGDFNLEDVKNSGFLLGREEGFIANVNSMYNKLSKAETKRKSYNPSPDPADSSLIVNSGLRKKNRSRAFSLPLSAFL